MKLRYFLSRDNSCHWYIIPEEYRTAWTAFLNLDEDDEQSWDIPTFATAVGGSPELVTFENYRCYS